MITQRIDAHLAGAKRATVSVGKHLGDGRSETPAEKSLPNVLWETNAYAAFPYREREKNSEVAAGRMFCVCCEMQTHD